MLAIFTALGILYKSLDGFNQGQLSPFGMAIIVDIYNLNNGKEVELQDNTG
jgi:hypothetical protein